MEESGKNNQSVEPRETIKTLDQQVLNRVLDKDRSKTKWREMILGLSRSNLTKFQELFENY